MKKALIIDSGLRNLGGHNFSYTKAVQAALEQRGFTVTVFANKHLPGDLARDLGYHPIFSLGAYDYPPSNSAVRDLIHLYAQSIIYSDELQHALNSTNADDYGLVFCHTVNDFELIGWSRYLSRHALPGILMILQRQTPRFQTCSRWKLIAHPYWRIKPHYLNAIHARLGQRFVLLTDSESLTEDYARIYRHRIVTLPIPINEAILSEAEAAVACTNDLHLRYGLRPGEGICIGYMGDAREAKGFLLLPEVVRRVLSEASAKTRFVIQCPGAASGIDNGKLPNGVAELKRLADEAGNKLVLIPERLSEPDYASLFGYLDIVLLPYLNTNFVEGTSSVFTEASALSKPVVVPGGTWMSKELMKSGGGVSFRTGDVDDLTAKVLQLVGQYDEYAAKARAFSPRWKSFHNARSLVDILLKASKLDSVSAAAGTQGA